MRKHQGLSWKTTFLLAAGVLGGTGCGSETGTPADTPTRSQKTGVGERPDLVITEWSSPPSVRPGDSFTVTAKVCNQGLEYADSNASLALVLSTDDTLEFPTPGSPPSMDQVWLGQTSLRWLYVGRCQTVQVSGTANLPPSALGSGAYYLGLIVDAQDSIDESDEDNNTAVRLTGVGHDADLVITEVTPPTSARPGSDFTTTVKVCNQGTGYAGATWVDLFLSTDTTLAPHTPGSPPDPDQSFVGSVSVSSLSPGQCSTRDFRGPAFVPPSAQPGQPLHVGAIVDSGQFIDELREDNNTRVSGLMGVGFLPDLVITDLRSPASARPGSSFTVAVTVCNQGTMSSPWSQGELYLSTTPEPTVPHPPGSMTQVRVGFLDVPQLEAGQCTTRNATAWGSQPPAAMMDVPVYLSASLDAEQFVTELREDNNTRLAGRFGLGYGPDLIVTDVHGPASVRPGDTFTATVTVCNQGTENSYFTQAQLFLSTTDSLEPLDFGPGPISGSQMYIGFVDVPNIGAGRCLSRDVSVPAMLPYEAQYDQPLYLGAIVDTSQSVQELREDNNAHVGALMGVGHLPDLVVTELLGPPSVTSGASFTVNARVCNQGTYPASGYGARLELFFSMTPALQAPLPMGPPFDPRVQSHLGSADVPNLDAGQCATLAIPATAQLPYDAPPDQPLYLGVLVDPQQYVEELREDNNAYVAGLVGVGSREDLVVTDLSGPASAEPGASFTATVTVCNEGTQTSSSGTELEFYLSVSSTLVPRQGPPSFDLQRPIGVLTAPAIAAGQCLTSPVSLRADVPYAAQPEQPLYLGAIVDPNRWVQELREDNNAYVAGLVGVGFQPDLVVTAVSGPPSAEPGQFITASVTVCNQGTRDSIQGTRVEAYIASVPSIELPEWNGPGMPGMETQRMLGFVSVPVLAPGQCFSGDASGPAWTPYDGSPDPRFYVGAAVDTDRFNTELREDNNTRVGERIGVGYEPDLVIASLSAPFTVQLGAPFTASVEVCNQGTSFAGNTSLTLYLSKDTVLDLDGPSGPGTTPAQVSLGSFPVSSLEAGQCTTSTVTMPAYTPPGVSGVALLYFGGVIDREQWTTELREDNNARADHLIIVLP